MRNRISATLSALAWVLMAVTVRAMASAPSVADLDASARAAGNRVDVATHIGERIFSQQWPAQVSQISANAVGEHLIVGIRLWGVKFHHPITRDEFVAEIASLVDQTFAAAPGAEEIDVWTSVPVAIAKGVVVSGDLAMPTERTVFSVTVHRGDSAQAIVERAQSTGSSVFWDPVWANEAFEKRRP